MKGNRARPTELHMHGIKRKGHKGQTSEWPESDGEIDAGKHGNASSDDAKAETDEGSA